MCVGCGDLFAPNYPKQKFCRRGCSNIKHEPKKPCAACGEKPERAAGYCMRCYHHLVVKKKNLSTSSTLAKSGKKN